MNIDNPAALHFIMQDDIFLLKSEKELFESAGAETAAVTETIATPIENKAVEATQQIKSAEPVTPVLQPSPVKQAPVIKYRGSNKSGYVILVYYPSLEWMQEAHLSALENTLKRKGIEAIDVAIINMAAHSGITYQELSGQLKPQKLLLMGKESLPAEISAVKFNQLHQLSNCTTLYTFSFAEMMESNENKKIFWEQMKLL